MGTALDGLSAETAEALRARGLGAVLEPAEQAGGDAPARLAADLESLDWSMLDRQRATLDSAAETPSGVLTPPPLAAPSTHVTADNDAATDAGWQALRAGRVALCTVAGGQASRLGFDGPKGAFPLGPVSGASLFQVMAGSVTRLRRRAGVSVPWIIQTGPGNHASTQAFFADRDFFGLGRADVHFVCQGTLPALSPDGQLLLESPGALFRNPDGHGGFYRALETNGTFAALRERGADLLFYFQVDNALARIGDPVFLGHHLLAGAEMSVKVVEKKDPGEKVGLVVHLDGKATCIEYSDLDEATAEERAEDGGLRYRAGNIAIHAFGLDFAERMAVGDLPLHVARKKVKALDGGLEAVERDGVKFETFVFDALPLAARTVVQMCEREEEFSPVKNRSGGDSIRTARQDLSARNRRWVHAALPGMRPAAEGWFELQSGLALDSDDLRRRAGEVELLCGDTLLARTR